MAPPESPVPAPRPTKGTSNSRASLTNAGDVGGATREGDEVGSVLVDAAIVFVERQVLRPIEIAARTE